MGDDELKTLLVQQLELNAKLMARLEAVESRVAAPVAVPDLPQRTGESLFQEYALWVQPHPAAKPKIKSWKVGISAAKRVLGLPFQLDGVTVTLGALPWPQWTQRALDGWRTARSAQTTIRGGATTAATRDREISVLQSCFKWHALRKNISANPIAKTQRERKPKESRRQGYYTADQLEAFLAAAHPLLAKMMRLSFSCGGMRQDEARLLRRDEVDWAANTIVLRGERAKNGTARTITVTDEQMEILRGQALTSVGVYLFPSPMSPTGEPVPKSTLGHWIVRAQKKTGMTLLGERPNYHHTRHSFAMHSLAKGMPVPWLMDEAGWESPEMIAIYGKLAGSASGMVREIVNAPSPLGVRKPPLPATTPTDTPTQRRPIIVNRGK